MQGRAKPAGGRKARRRLAPDDHYTSEQQAADFHNATSAKDGNYIVPDIVARKRLLERVTRGPSAKLRGDANYRLGALYEDMYGDVRGRLKLDRYRARDHYQKAAADGDKAASIRMLRMEDFPNVYIKLRPDEFAPPERHEKSPGPLSRGIELFERDRFVDALPILTYHGKRGSSRAQYLLAYTYKFGNGIKNDDSRARAWCYLAAKGGLLAAQTVLGSDLLFNRIGHETEAELWLKRAARRNDCDAIGYLGILELYSRDGRRKPGAGLIYLEKAASMGSTFAMLRLGELYLGKILPGEVTVDRNRAKAWFMAAANTGDQEARELLRKHFRIKYDAPTMTGSEQTPLEKSRRGGSQKRTTSRASHKK